MNHPVATDGRLVHPTANTFWEWSLDQRTLITCSGKIGKPGRTTPKTLPKTNEASDELERRHFRKLREGYVQLSADNAGPIELQMWLTGNYTGFAAMDLHPATNRVAVARHTGNGYKSCEIVMIDVATGTVAETIPLKEFDISDLRFHGDGLYLHIDDRVLFLDPPTGAIQRVGASGMFPHLGMDLQANRLLYSCSRESKCVVVVDDLTTHETLLTIDVHAQRRVTDHRLNHVAALSPSGTWAALARHLGTIELFNINTGEQRVLRGDFPALARLAFHPDEQWLAFTEQYGDWRFRVWNLDGQEDTRWGKLKWTYPDGSPRKPECFDFALSPNGRWVALRDGRLIRLYDSRTRRLKTCIEQRHLARPWNTSGYNLTFASDGRLLTRTDCGVLTVYRID